MSHLQQHKEYGRKPVHDHEIESYLTDLYKRYGARLSFVQTILETGYHYDETPQADSIEQLNMDFDTPPSNPFTFFTDILKLAREAPYTAAACLDVSTTFGGVYNSATGGIKELGRPYRSAFFIDRFVSRVNDFRKREETPFAVLRAFAAGPITCDFKKYESRYEIFCGRQENDGRIQAPSIPSEVVSRGVLACLALISHASTTDFGTEISAEKTEWRRRLVNDISEDNADKLFHRYAEVGKTLSNPEVALSLSCILSGRFFIIERADEALACYYWDPDALNEVRNALTNYSEDTNGSKLHGSYWRAFLAWSLVAFGTIVSILSGSLNWAGRTATFERLNDIFSTFLLILSLPAFTVKIAATNGDQAIKDWLTGVRRIENMEQLEHIIHCRLRCNHRRGWLAIQRVKCETDNRQNWTASDNMSFKPGHLDGSLRATKDRSMSDLELVIAIDGTRARSLPQLSNETKIIGADVNHVQFNCGTTEQKRTDTFFSHTPSRRVWFA